MGDCIKGLKGCMRCLYQQLMNTLSKKQLAVLHVQSHPFLPDIVALSEALEQLGWGQ
jgi:hypothetical protein